MAKDKNSGMGRLSRRDFLKISSYSAGTLAVHSLINAADVFAKGNYPGDKITFIVPYTVGGGYDVYARSISPLLARDLNGLSGGSANSKIIIKNLPNAGGRQGCTAILKARPDGNTFGIIDIGTVTADIIGDADIGTSQFTILQLAVSTNKIIASSKKGFTTWEESINAMKKRPVKMAVGSFGLANHVSAIIVNELMGTKFKLINFPGTSENINALMRGDVDVMISGEEGIKAMIDAKELRPLAIMTENPDYPEAKSMKQLGFPEVAETCSAHRFIVAPPRLEAEPKRMLIAALKKASNDAEFLNWAKKSSVHLRNIFGSDAENMFLKYKKDYENLAPMLKKYLL